MDSAALSFLLSQALKVVLERMAADWATVEQRMEKINAKLAGEVLNPGQAALHSRWLVEELTRWGVGEEDEEEEAEGGRGGAEAERSLLCCVP